VKPSRVARLLALVVVAVIPVGCPVYLDFYDASQAASATSSGAGTGTGGGAGTGTSGTGGIGGGCAPASMAACYDGPAATEGHGLCQAGSKTCNAEGTAYGPCVGEVTPTPEDCATATDEDCDGLAPACDGAFAWSTRFGDGQNQTGNAIVADASGDIFVGGYFDGAIDLGGGMVIASAGGADAFVVKLGPTGAPVWGRGFGDAAYQSVSSLAADEEGSILATGSFAGAVDFGGGGLVATGSSDVFLVKLDTNGAYVYGKRFGGLQSQGATAIRVDSGGAAFVTGFFTGSIDFGPGAMSSVGGADVFVAKIDSAGNTVWAKSFGDAANQYGEALGVTAAGDVVVAGDYLGSINLGGKTLVNTAGIGAMKLFVAKLDTNGQHVWSKSFGESGKIANIHLATSPQGDVGITGSFTGSVDFGGGALVATGGSSFFVAKLDMSGQHVWSASFGEPGSTTTASIALDATGNAIVAGGFLGTVDFGGGQLVNAGEGSSDAFVAKFGSHGAHKWSKRFGDALAQDANSVTLTPQGRIAVVGSMAGTINFGGGPLMSAGQSDVFVAAFEP
jgi:hypothetical protein